MGGLSGHMMHPHDNLELSGNQLTELCWKSLIGELGMKEKFDGFNIHMFNWNGEIRFARNASELAQGGFPFNQAHTRFENPQVAHIFYVGCKRLATTVNPTDLSEFHESGRTYNVEIIAEGTTNIMPYNFSKVIIHNIWVWAENSKGKLEQISKDIFHGLPNITPEPFLKYDIDPIANPHNIEHEIKRIYGEMKLDTDRPIWDLYLRRMFVWLHHKEFFINEEAIIVLFKRFFKIGEQPNLREIKKEFGDIYVTEILENQKEIMGFCKEPLEKLILQIGTSILSNVLGYANEWEPYKVCAALEQKLNKVLDNADQYQVTRLEWVKCNIMPLEGVVVNFNGQEYKWTGPFGPINQILGKAKRES